MIARGTAIGPASVLRKVFDRRVKRTLRIGEKVVLLVILTGIALTLVFALTVLFGALNERKLQEIRNSHYPAVQTSQQLREILVEVNQELRGGVTTRDPDFLRSSDSLRAEFMKVLSTESASDAFTQLALDEIGKSFDGYFPHARAVSERLIYGEVRVTDGDDLAAMREGFEATRLLLDASADAASLRIDNAFAAAQRLQRAAWLLVALITLMCLLAISRLSRSAIHRLTMPMADAVQLADRLAQGDIGTRTEVTSDDEVGQLQEAMQRMLDYLAEMAEVARAIAGGDLSARPRPRSEFDAFGNAFMQMTEYLTDMAAIARRIAGGDLSPKIELRSSQDGFGTALTGMVANLSQSMAELRGSEQQNRELASQLQVSRDRLEHLMSSGPAVIYSRSLEPGTPLTFVSPNASTHLGLCPETIVGDADSWSRALHPDDQGVASDALAQLRETGSSSVEYRVRLADGGVRWIQDQATVVVTTGSVPGEIVGWWMNVSARKDAEESLRVSEEQLRMAQRLEAVGQLAGGIAHDFNNLLTAILSYSELLRDDLPADDPKLEDIGEITKAARRAATLTQQLLTFSRKQVSLQVVLDVNGVVTDMEKMLRRLIGEHIACRTSLGAHEMHVCADPGQIEQILVNLAVNSRDAMPDGGTLTISTRLVLDSEAAQAGVPIESTGTSSYVLLEVTDTGSGMDAETRDRMFEPFFTTKPVGSGTGLGLATVYGIVNRSGGHIRVRSEPGHGTTFFIYIPVAEGAADGAHPIFADVTLPHQRETVLLVEDDDAIRKLARKILERAGYIILEAKHGEEALSLCAGLAASIDLVLTDVVMPVMGGPQMMAGLWLKRPGTRVLFMSGYTDGNVSADSITGPGTGFLAKPFSPASLTASVRRILDEVA